MSASEDLRRFPLLKHVDDAGIVALSKALRRRAFPRNTLLFRKGDPGQAMMLIVAGQVRIFLNDEQGNEITFRTIGAGQILGEYSMLDGQPRSASASAITTLDTLILLREDFLHLLRERPLVGVELMHSLAERVRYATSYLERLHEALELLSNSEYEQAIREMALAADADEMRELITTFVTLVHQMQTRQQGDRQK